MVETTQTYLVVGNKPWNRSVFDEVISRGKGDWHYVGVAAELTVEFLEELNPNYIFFLHWSHKVSSEITSRWECVCFHMTDVPYGRGGSPLQNLIVSGHRGTKLTALQMASEMDAGPVYLNAPLSLEGSAEEIYIRATHLAAKMIQRITTEKPVPVPQTGEVVVFKRRTEAESEISADIVSLEALYDFVRMLDARTYPRAFLTRGSLRFEFSRIALYDGRLVADVSISLSKKGPS